jgi:hypothetical protein
MYSLVHKTFGDLPDANKLQFQLAEAVELGPLLPHLPPTESHPPETRSHFIGSEPQPNVLDLVHRLLVYPETKRLGSADALKHLWFDASPDHILPQVDRMVGDTAPDNMDGVTLGQLLSAILRPADE